MIYRVAFTAFLLTILINSSWCMMAGIPEPVPVARLIENVSRHVTLHPDDAHGYFILGRAHALAFVGKKETTILSFDQFSEDSEISSIMKKYCRIQRTDLPEFDYGESVLIKKKERRPLQPFEEEHLLQSVHNYYRAVTLDPANPLYCLALAWILEYGSSYSIQVGAPPLYDEIEDIQPFVPSKYQISSHYLMKDLLEKKQENYFYDREQRRRYSRWNTRFILTGIWPLLEEEQRSLFHGIMLFYWKENALQYYRQAFYNSIFDQIDHSERIGASQSNSVSNESGEGIIRLLTSRPSLPEYEWEMNSVKQALSLTEYESPGGFSSNGVSPVIFSLSEHKPLADLLDLEVSTSFDLDGDYHPSRWTWLKPDTAILVWDPEHTGRINSGRQLFGSVTWWCFWKHGYQAMAALDDDGDGFLSGTELNGLAIWRDRNQNGVSDSGEVVPVSQTDIEKFSVNPDGKIGNVYICQQGIMLKNGTSLPTYDWIAEPVTPQKP